MERRTRGTLLVRLPAAVLAAGLLAALVSLGPSARAQTASELRADRLTLEDGLSQGEVSDILQDRHGFLWFGTIAGLNRYDGHTVTVFEPIPFDRASLADGTVTSLHEDRAGTLWVATAFGGVARLDGDEGFTHFQHDPGDAGSLSTDATTAVLVDRRGVLWIGTDEGLNRRRGERFVHYRHDPDDPTSLSDDRVRSLFEGADGTLWVATANGLNRLDRATGRFTRYLYESGRSADRSSLHRQIADPSLPGVRWIGSDDGIVRFDEADGSVRRFSPNARASGGNAVHTVAPDPWRPGVLWVPILGVGLARFDTVTETFTRHTFDTNDPSDLGETTGTTVHTDRSGMVWVGRLSDGLTRFDPAAAGVTVFGAATPTRPGLRNPNVWGIGVMRDGRIWTGTSGGLLHLTTPGTGAVRVWEIDPSSVHRSSTRRPAGEANAIAEAADGTVWLGTDYGLDHYDPVTDRFTHYRHVATEAGSLSHDGVRTILVDRAGDVWVGTREGLDRFDPDTETVTRYIRDPGQLGETGVESILEDHAGRIWFTAQQEVRRLDRATGRVTTLRHDPLDPATPTSGQFVWLHERAREPGVVWAASDGGGLDRIDARTGGIRHYTTQSSELPDNTVYAILEDDDGRLWLSTNRGLARFDPDEPEPSLAFRRFGVESGLASLEFNQHAAARGPDGRLYFGGVRGVVGFRPQDLVGNPVPPEVALTELLISNERVRPGPGTPLARPLMLTDALTLRYRQRNVTLAFAALHFKNPERNRYRYRLDGVDRDWVEAGAQRTASYTNLPPGRYTFSVTAANSDGVWTPEPRTLALTVLAPWWRTWPAALGGGVLALGLGALLARRRRDRWRLRHQMETERLEADKLRELGRTQSRFFANVTHEFRTPLTLTLGPLNDALAGEHGTLPDALRPPLALARRNAQRVLDLVGQMLDVARLEAGRTLLRASPADLGTVVGEGAAPFRALADRSGVAFEVVLPDGEVAVWIDAPQLETALSNLLANAIQYTPEGGTVRVLATADDTHARVAVQDSGPGIPADDLPYVFDRFHRVDESAGTPGTGIGLSLALEIVHLHGGTLSVASERGVGSTFTIVLPLGRDHLADDAIASSPPERTARLVLDGDGLPSGDGAPPGDDEDDRTTILVVEDHVDLRAYVRRHLEPTYRVIEAADGQAGLDAARAHLPDLIVSDVMMPRLDGLGLVRALRADPATDFIPVLLLTAKAAPEDRLAGLSALADGYLTKPFDPAELRVRVSALIAKRQTLRERFLQQGMALVIGEGDEALAPPLVPAAGGVDSADGRFVEAVRQAIEASIGDDELSVDRLAEAVSLSRSQLYRKLKAALGQTPAEAIQAVRLARAEQLLEAGAGTVTEVAYAVGFKSVSHFSRRFRAATGRSPSKVRRTATGTRLPDDRQPLA